MAEDEMVEIFRTSDALGAQTAIDEVLKPAGIEAVLLDRTQHMLPAASQMGSYFVAVPIDEVENATEELKEALEDGAIDGEVIVDPDAEAEA
jgi:hypothetical protein